MLEELNHKIKENIIEHAKIQFPKESCGLIINFKGKLKYIECTNISEDNYNFIIDPLDYAKAEDLGTILYIVHSHPNTKSDPSFADIHACNVSKIPWIIVSYPNIEFNRIIPKEAKLDYVGRQFYHGIIDCYSLIRDYYKDELNIELFDFERENFWWYKNKNLYIENYESQGFKKIPVDEKPQLHDIILIQYESKVANHGAIYLGNGKILHHPAQRLSCIQLYDGMWQKNTWCIVRHKSLWK